MINEEVKHIVEAELREGEEFLWADKSKKLIFSVIEKLMFGFLIVWLALCFLIIGMPLLISDEPQFEVIINGNPELLSFTEYLMFVSIFPLFALGMFAIVYGFALLRTGHIYAITDRRAIIISKFLGKRVASYSPSRLGKIQTYQTKNNLGSVTFYTHSQGKFEVLMKPFELQNFSGIENIKEVESLILSLQNKGTPS